MPRKAFEHAPPFSRQMAQKPNRLTGQRWTNMRNQWLRTHPQCVRCGRPGEEVHHVVPRVVAPERTFDVTNLATMCRSCHHALHNDA